MAVDIANLLSAEKYVAIGSEKLKRRGPQNNHPTAALIQSSLNCNTIPRVRYRLNDPTPPTQVFYTSFAYDIPPASLRGWRR